MNTRFSAQNLSRFMIRDQRLLVMILLLLLLLLKQLWLRLSFYLHRHPLLSFSVVLISPDVLRLLLLLLFWWAMISESYQIKRYTSTHTAPYEHSHRTSHIISTHLYFMMPHFIDFQFCIYIKSLKSVSHFISVSFSIYRKWFWF